MVLIIKLFKLLFGSVGSPKGFLDFIFNAFFGLCMNKKKKFKILKRGVPENNHRLS